MVVLQAGFSLALCVACAYLLPALYIGGALAVAIVSIILLMMNWRTDDEHELSTFAIEFVYRFLLGLVVGAIWPCLPVIFAARPKADARPSNTSD